MSDTLFTEPIELVGAGHGRNGGASSGRSSGGDANSPAYGVPQRTYVTGIIIALSGIVMFFTALGSAFIVRQGFAITDVQFLAVPRILWLNTLILLASSVTLLKSRRSFLAGQEDEFRHWWGLTAILGLFFLAGQTIAWWQMVRAGVYLATNPDSSFFYVFTVAHAIHLFGGIAALLAVAFRRPRHLTRVTATEVAAIYWHFMDGLWVCLLVLFVAERWL
jgi:cytochrome c oxidase subunit 3